MATPKKNAAKKGYRDGAAGRKPKTSLIQDESNRSMKYSSAYKRGTAARKGAEGPKKSSPRKVSKRVAKRLSDGRRLGR
jgi:hypothetical protein